MRENISDIYILEGDTNNAIFFFIILSSYNFTLVIEMGTENISLWSRTLLKNLVFDQILGVGWCEEYLAPTFVFWLLAETNKNSG